MENKNNYNSEDEIDLVASFKTILEGKKIIIRFIVIFGLIGLFIAVFSEKEYTASVTLVPQISKSKVGGNLGGLAAIAGINLGGGSVEEISPVLYPKIIKSVLFQKELIRTPLTFLDLPQNITYKEYYDNYEKFNLLRFIKSNTIGLPSKVLKIFKSKPKEIAEVTKDSIYRVTIENNALYKKIQSQLALEINKNEGFVQLSFTMSEALPAAQMTINAQKLLQEAITNFKIQKSNEKLLFVKQSFKEQENKLKKAQQELAFYRDSNRSFNTSVSKTKLENLEANYSVIYSVYAELAKQLESQKIQVKEDTPVFTVINPVVVPTEKSSPKRLIIILLWVFCGVFLGFGTVLVKDYFLKIKSAFNN